MTTGTPEGETPRPARPVPRPRRGPMHVIDATLYSIAGFRHLWHETAVRLELAAAVAGGVLLWLTGAGAGAATVAFILLLALLATEALNTAIEVLTNRVSPGWSVDAKHAKDLGSLAVGLMILANVVWLVAACLHLV